MFDSNDAFAQFNYLNIILDITSNKPLLDNYSYQTFIQFCTNYISTVYKDSKE